jgi:protein phosphatase
MTEEFDTELSPSGAFPEEQPQAAPPAGAAPESASAVYAEPEALSESAPQANPEPDLAPASEPGIASTPAPDAALDSAFAEESTVPGPAMPSDDAMPSPPSAVKDESPLLRIAFSALSDIGCVRTNNEDFFGYDEQLGLFAVCDGMGGMASGEVASSNAVQALISGFASHSFDAPVSARLLHAINLANQVVWENGQIPENKGMGTTAVVAALDGNKLIIGNVGDSRAYILQDGQCIQLTVDHSYINELIRNGTITLEDAQHADFQGMENVITRAVGVAPEVQPDFYSVDLKPGTAVLLATDGLSRYVLPDEIFTIVGRSSFDSAAANLIDVAKQRGGLDNITCILLLALPD